MASASPSMSTGELQVVLSRSYALASCRSMGQRQWMLRRCEGVGGLNEHILVF